MSAQRLSQPVRAVAAGLACLAVLAAMLVAHAWPLWTGRVITMPVTLAQGRDAFRGERVNLALPGARIVVGDPATIAAPETAVVLPAKGDWWGRVPADLQGRRRVLIARVVYLQLAADAATSTYLPVSISDKPADGAVNLQGRIRRVDSAGVIDVDYGLDAYYMQEGQARQFEQSSKGATQAHVQVAIARSGRARIKGLFVNGVGI